MRGHFTRCSQLVKSLHVLSTKTSDKVYILGVPPQETGWAKSYTQPGTKRGDDRVPQ